MKIVNLELENVKRCKAVRIQPKESGLTVIGGGNAQGKTSVLDAIAYALGGENYRPSNLKLDEAVGNPIIHIETDDGLVIERKGKNSDLTVTDQTGRRFGQTLLNSFVTKFAIDLPKFMNASTKEKTKQLLENLGIGEELMKLDREYQAKENTRLLVGRERDKKRKAAEDLPFYEDAPAERMSVSDLIKEQQEILARNGIRARMRAEKNRYAEQLADAEQRLRELVERVDELNAKIDEAENPSDDETTEEIEKRIANYEEVNAKIDANEARRTRMEEADELSEQYDAISAEMKEITKRRIALLKSVELPVDGLSVSTDGELTLDGKSWDCMSGSQQLLVSAAIASRINPKCRFMLMDKMEQFDRDNLAKFGKWLEERDLQCICTRVATDDTAQIVIEDGEVVRNSLETKEEEY